MGSGAGKRYYIDVVLTPAVLVDGKGQLQDMDHQVMVYHEAGERIVDYIDGDPEHGWQVPLTETIDKIEITTRPHTDLWQRTYYHFRNDNAPMLQMETEEKFFSFVVKKVRMKVSGFLRKRIPYWQERALLSYYR